MADVSLAMAPVAERESDVLDRLGLAEASYLLLTVHRAGNVDREEPLARLVEQSPNHPRRELAAVLNAAFSG